MSEILPIRLSYCKFWIYWVGVDSKLTIWGGVKLQTNNQSSDSIGNIILITSLLSPWDTLGIRIRVVNSEKLQYFVVNGGGEIFLGYHAKLTANMKQFLCKTYVIFDLKNENELYHFFIISLHFDNCTINKKSELLISPITILSLRTHRKLITWL